MASSKAPALPTTANEHTQTKQARRIVTVATSGLESHGRASITIDSLLKSGVIIGHKDGNYGSCYPRVEEFGTEGIPFLTAKSLNNGRIDIEAAPRLSERRANELRFGFVKPGDVLLSHNATIGRVAVVPEFTGRMLIGTSLTYFRVDPAKLSPRYLAAYFSSADFQHQLAAVMSHSTRNQVPVSAQRGLRIVVPSLTEQVAIANVLGVLDEKIELNRRMNETLEGIARAIFKSWFVDFDPVKAKAEGREPGGMDPATAALFPSEFQDSELGSIPSGWNIRTIDEEFQITMGQSPPGDTYNEIGDGLPFYQGRTDFGFRFPRRRVYCSQPTRLANEGDTLVSVRAPVGDVNMAAEKCSIGRGVSCIRHHSGSRSYTYYAMRSFRSIFDRFEAEGTVFGSISKTDFHAIQQVVPPANVIKQFEEICFPLDEHISTGTALVETLSNLRDALLPRLISGKLRVPEAEEMLAEAF